MSGEVYHSIRYPKILRIKEHAQTVCTRPFLPPSKGLGTRLGLDWPHRMELCHSIVSMHTLVSQTITFSCQVLRHSRDTEHIVHDTLLATTTTTKSSTGRNYSLALLRIRPRQLILEFFLLNCAIKTIQT